MSGVKKKIALVADWITHWGGAERILVKLMEIYPDAEIYTSVFFPDRPEHFIGRKIHKSFIQYIPYLNRRHKLCMLLRPLAFWSFNFQKYDLVISCSSAEAKGIITKRKEKKEKRKEEEFKNNPSLNIEHSTLNNGPVHICYCHTPTRYLWSHSEEYKNFLEFGWLNWLAKLIIPVAFRTMKKWDYRAAQRPDIFVANSITTQMRIAEFYKRESVVVYPFFKPLPSFSGKGDHCDSRDERDPGIQVNDLPGNGSYNSSGIDSTSRSPARLAGMTDSGLDPRLRGNDGKGYFVCLGRIVPYKRFDLAIRACNQLGYKLKIFTNTKNAESERLKKLSGPTIEWIFGASDREVGESLQKSRGFIMPQFEDFGIVALEAMSYGVPVIAYGEGGATETVVHGQTGLLFSEQTVESLVNALEKSFILEWNPEIIREQSLRFSEERFETEFSKVVNDTII